MSTTRTTTTYRTASNGTAEHRCSSCHKWLPADLDHFVRASNAKSGFGGCCKPCNRQRTRAWAAANPDRYRAGIRKCHQEQFQGLANVYEVIAGTAYIEIPDAQECIHIAMIDEADLPKLIDRNTRWVLDQGTGYARAATFLDGRETLMHRVILGVPTNSKIVTDHANRDRLDNRQANLRVVSASVNARNCGIKKSNTSGFPGVSWAKRDLQWRVQIRTGNGNTYMRQFDDFREACLDARRIHVALGVPAGNLPPISAEPTMKVAA